MILCDGLEVRPDHLRLAGAEPSGPSLADVLDLSGTLAEVGRRAMTLAEDEAVQRALREADGDRAAAAERLGISLSTLNRRLRAPTD